MNTIKLERLLEVKRKADEAERKALANIKVLDVQILALRQEFYSRHGKYPGRTLDTFDELTDHEDGSDRKMSRSAFDPDSPLRQYERAKKVGCTKPNVLETHYPGCVTLGMIAAELGVRIVTVSNDRINTNGGLEGVPVQRGITGMGNVRWVVPKETAERYIAWRRERYASV